MQAHFRAGTLTNLAIFLPLMRAFYAEDRHPFDEGRARSALAGLLEDSRWGLAWLIDVDGALAGYVVLTFGYSLEFGGRDATLDELYLREAYRGQGIGRQVLEHVIDVCREHGIHALHLEVEVHNRRAHGVYRAMGFAEDDSTLMTKVLAERSE
jgi:GNAT superfamily N-acetyltransferase